LPNAGRDIGDRIVLAPSMAYLERAFDRAKHGAVSDEPFVEFRISEPGVGAASTLRAASVLLQWAPYRLKGSGWDNAARDRLGDLALHSVERVLPGFSERVVSRQVLSPLDIEQHYGASDGSLTHGELALDQILFMRPVPSLSRYRSQGIEGLYLCGRGCHPGMPVPAAQLAVREIAQAHEPAAAPPAA
jgi:phytoene dehydrogenase-like protein